MCSGFEACYLQDLLMSDDIAALEIGQGGLLTSDLNDWVDIAGETRTLVHSKLSFSFNT